MEKKDYNVHHLLYTCLCADEATRLKSKMEDVEEINLCFVGCYGNRKKKQVVLDFVYQHQYPSEGYQQVYSGDLSS